MKVGQVTGEVVAFEVRKGSTTAKVSNASYDRVKAYSEATGVPISRVIDDSIDLWMSTVGEARLEVLGESASSA